MYSINFKMYSMDCTTVARGCDDSFRIIHTYRTYVFVCMIGIYEHKHSNVVVVSHQRRTCSQTTSLRHCQASHRVDALDDRIFQKGPNNSLPSRHTVLLYHLISRTLRPVARHVDVPCPIIIIIIIINIAATPPPTTTAKATTRSPSPSFSVLPRARVRLWWVSVIQERGDCV
jgi:hypothetical protein